MNGLLTDALAVENMIQRCREGDYDNVLPLMGEMDHETLSRVISTGLYPSHMFYCYTRDGEIDLQCALLAVEGLSDDIAERWRNVYEFGRSVINAENEVRLMTIMEKYDTEGIILWGGSDELVKTLLKNNAEDVKLFVFIAGIHSIKRAVHIANIVLQSPYYNFDKQRLYHDMLFMGYTSIAANFKQLSDKLLKLFEIDIREFYKKEKESYVALVIKKLYPEL